MKPNPVADEPETILWTGSYSGKAMIGQWIAVAVVTVALGVAAVLFPVAAFFLAIAIVILWGITIAQWAVRKLSFYYELSNQRLKHRAGILKRTNDRIELIDIDDVLFKQGIVQAMLGVGNITISSSDVSNPSLTLVGIDDVKKIADLVDNARRAERRKRSLFIESV